MDRRKSLIRICFFIIYKFIKIRKFNLNKMGCCADREEKVYQINIVQSNCFTEY